MVVHEFGATSSPSCTGFWLLKTVEGKVVVKEKPLTRRGVLSFASSLYDPPGFGAPFTLLAKVLVQELCKKKLG